MACGHPDFNPTKPCQTCRSPNSDMTCLCCFNPLDLLCSGVRAATSPEEQKGERSSTRNRLCNPAPLSEQGQAHCEATVTQCANIPGADPRDAARALGPWADPGPREAVFRPRAARHTAPCSAHLGADFWITTFAHICLSKQPKDNCPRRLRWSPSIAASSCPEREAPFCSPRGEMNVPLGSLAGWSQIFHIIIIKKKAGGTKPENKKLRVGGIAKTQFLPEHLV